MASIYNYFPQLSLKRFDTPTCILASHFLCPFDHELLIRPRARPVLGRVDVSRWNVSPSSMSHRRAECRGGLLAEQARVLRDQLFRHVVVENIRRLFIEQNVRFLEKLARQTFQGDKGRLILDYLKDQVMCGEGRCVGCALYRIKE